MVRLKDIAVEAGVTEATVSYVLNGRQEQHHISEKTCLKVHGIAKKLGYKFDDIARAMATGKTNAIGFIARETTYEFVAAILTGAMRQAAEHDYFIKLLNHHDGITADEIIQVCRKQRLSGLICYNLDYEILKALELNLCDCGIPVAQCSNGKVPERIVHAMTNDYQGGCAAIQYLCDLGHKKILYICNDSTKAYAIDRKNGYIDTLKKNNIDFNPELVFSSDRKGALIDFLAAKVLNKKNGPTAVFCVSDWYATSVISYLQSNNIKVPSDISVVGYGNLFSSEFSIPSITTIAEPNIKLGAKTVELILKKIKNKDKNAKYTEIMDIELIKRDSVAALKTYERCTV
jgi:DNA-binding LacI/PurR family transcriptional regulator